MSDFTTDDYGTAVYFDDDGEPMKECCVLAEPHWCGDCYGGYPDDGPSSWEDDYARSLEAAARRHPSYRGPR